MNLLRQLVLVFFVIFSSAWTAYSRSTTEEETKLSLEEFLNQSKIHDPNYESILLERLKLRFQRDLALPNRRLLIEVRNQYGFAADEARTTQSLSLRTQKEFSTTGTSLLTELTKNQQEDRNEQTASLLISQDLWKNGFGKRTQIQNKMFDAQDQSLKLQVLESYEDYLEQRIKNYLDLHLAKLNVDSAENLYKDALILENQIRKRKQNNIADQTDLDQARLQSLSRKQELLEAQTLLETQSKQLFASLGIQQQTFPTTVAPESLIDTEIDLAAELQNYLTASRSSKILEEQSDSQRLAVEYFESGRSPEVKLLAGFQYDDSERFSESVNRQESILGLSFSYSFGDSQMKALVSQAHMNQQKSQIDKQVFRLQSESRARSLYSQIKHQKQLYDLLEEKLRLTNRVVGSMQSRYQMGRIDLDTLIRTKNEKAQTQFEFDRQQVLLSKYAVEWLSFTDQLLAEEEIH